MANVYFTVTSFIFCIMLNVVFFSKERLRTLDNKIFSVSLIMTMIGVLLEFFCFLLYFFFDAGDSIFYYISSRLILFYYILWGFCLLLYILQVSKFFKIYSFFKKIILFILIIDLVLPLDFNTVDGMMIPFGLAAFFVYFITVIYIALGFIAMFINLFKNKFDKRMLKKYIPLISLIFVGTFIMYIQFSNPKLLLMSFLHTIILYTMYFTIENPDMKMIEELEIAKEAADKANQAKSEFLSNMSHEIRTPLNAVVGFSEALKYDNIPPESMEKVDDIIMASNSLLDLVNGILDISKIEANKLEIIDKEYDVKSMLDELAALAKSRIGDKSLEFRVNFDPSIPSVLYGDNVRVKQVILNILTNAVKYTKEGFVDFTVSSIIKDDVCRLIISVEDSGIGIREESLPRLFSKFDRLNVEKSLTIEGTGLGLAITKKLIELMNGNIVVQSVYGQGSKFTISLDQRIVSMNKPLVKETLVSDTKFIDAKGSRILVVDDNEINIKVASTLLKKYNFNIDSATSGELCLKKLNDGEEYDIIFLDDMMPRMSGRDVIKKLRSNPDFNIPTIALTANAIEGMKEEYLSLGFDDYLSKPINKTELERVIKKYLHEDNSKKVNTVKSFNATSIIDLDTDLPKVVKDEVDGKDNIVKYSGKKVLIVDDNDINIKVAIMNLKKYNLDITSCNSGSDALLKVIENSYDLIFLDDLMPEMDGCTTYKNMKDIEGFNTPTIMMTASRKEEVKDKLKEYGFNGYLSKPFSKVQLEKILDDYLK